MIYWLEYIGILILRSLLNVLQIFPVRNNRILFYSFNGKQYSCNPRKITEYLLAYMPDEYEIIWAFNDPDKFKGLTPDTVKRVRYRSFLYYYYAKTSKVVIFNVQGYGEVSRRRGQIFIQTWHASNGYKKVGTYLKGIQRKMNLLGHKDYSYVMCGSRNMEEHRVRGSMNYKGEIIKGTPRMDSIIKRDLVGMREKVFSKLSLDFGKKIVLYAPTWRADRNKSEYGIEFEMVKCSFENRFGGEWIIVIRLHPNVRKKGIVNAPFVIDATDYPDMEDLVYVADAMISDYSSAIWDFSFTGKPCFLLCTDLEEYDTSKGFILPIETWGFPLSTSLAELNKQIMQFSMRDFEENMIQHHKDMGSLEDGHATERVCSLIDSIVKNREG